uniref:Uncharacterized protein n=1 Tax=Myotis myotis TaxID=51298 RepID=A0A7J7XI38_MYOMY|nr:hypothetical protein mMyoMyo1_011603 [Myotis myotis]
MPIPGRLRSSPGWEISPILSSVQDMRPNQGCSGHPVSHRALGTELILSLLPALFPGTQCASAAGAEPDGTVSDRPACSSTCLLILGQWYSEHIFLYAIFNLNSFPRRGALSLTGPLCSVEHLEESENALICMMAGEQCGVPEASVWGGRR